MRTRLHMWAPSAGVGEVEVVGEWGQRRTQQVIRSTNTSEAWAVLPKLVSEKCSC